MALSNEVQASIVTLAGQWAFDWTNKREAEGSLSDHDKLFIDDFVTNYNLLVKAFNVVESSQK